MTNFNEKIDRLNNDSRKWKGREKFFGRADVTPMWVADMDVKTPTCVMEALKSKINQEIFGYTMESYEYKESLVNWVAKRHNYKISHERLVHSPTVVTSLNLLVKTLTEKGDNILIQSPTYPQFSKQTEKNDRKILINPLVKKNKRFEIDFIDFEEKAKISKLFILCNPHNPTGRVFEYEELKKMAEICLKYNVKIISDEIHADLILKGKHISLGSISEKIDEITYTCYSATKTFNLAGIQSSFVHFPNMKDKDEFFEELMLIGVHEPNSFCMSMVIAAYNEGQEWLEELLNHIRENIKYAIEYINKNLPEIEVTEIEATYLLWLDFSKYNLTAEELKDALVKKGGLGLTMGDAFLDSNYGRMNVACPRYLLEEGLEKLKKSFK